jgi:hypothetical protein
MKWYIPCMYSLAFLPFPAFTGIVVRMLISPLQVLILTQAKQVKNHGSITPAMVMTRVTVMSMTAVVNTVTSECDDSNSGHTYSKADSTCIN